MIRVFKENYFLINEIEEYIGLVEGYSIDELIMNEDNADSIRQRAIQKMIAKACLENADVIVDFEIVSTHLQNGYYEVYCSGTALKLHKKRYLN